MGGTVRHRASITPSGATAGQRGTWCVTIEVGSGGIKVGGAVRIRPPEMGMVRWEVGMVTARASRAGTACDVRLSDCHPLSYHWRHAPIIQVDIYGTDLLEGDSVTVTIGERGGYSRGYLRRARAQEHAQDDARWDVWVDAEGNKSLQPERAIDEVWEELDPIPMRVSPAITARLSVVSGQPAPGREDFGVLIVARDHYGNHCVEHEGGIRIVTGSGTLAGQMRGGSASCELHGVAGEVVRPCVVDAAAELTGTSNPVCSGFAGDHTVFFGDLHVMTGEGVIASALADTEYAYRWAGEVGGLDFCSVTNKVDRWQEDLALDDQFYDPGEFVTLPGCENSFPTGHKNVYFPDTTAPAPDPTTVESLFRSLGGREALVIPHHTSVFSESSRETFWREHDFTAHRPGLERLIEITQDRGSMEREEIGGNVYFGGTGSSVWSALQRGLKLGFVGGTDNHRAQPGETRSPMGGLDPDEVVVGGLTAVLATELTREAVWEALWNRRCYATQGQRTLLTFEVSGFPMGSVVEGRSAGEMMERREFSLRLVGHRMVTRVELVRSDGRITDLVAAGAVGLTDGLMQAKWIEDESLAEVGGVAGSVFYYLRVTEADGRMAWSSPVWVSLGDACPVQGAGLY